MGTTRSSPVPVAIDVGGSTGGLWHVAHDRGFRARLVRESIAMNDEHHLLGALADGLGALAFLTEPGGRMVWCNQQFEVQTGFTVEHFQFENPDNPFIHPDDLPKVGAFLADFAVGTAPVSDPLENRFFDRWGTVLSYRSVVRRTEWNGEMAFLVLATRVQHDVTSEHAVRGSEERYRRLVERANDGIVQLTADGRVLFANERFHALVGLDAVGLAKVRFGDLVHPDDRDRAERVRAATPKEGTRAELRLLGPSGTEHLVEVDLVPLQEEPGVQAILRDVTGPRALEERAREQQKLESLGLLAGNVAHDFNNVLTGILGNLSLARVEVPDRSDIATLLEEAEQATEQAAGLAHMLLAYAGRAPAHRGMCDLGQLVAHSEPLLTASAGRQARLTLSLAPEPILAVADGAQLTQVLLNLVTNACEATSAEGTVTVETERARAAGPDRGDWVVGPPTGSNWGVLRVSDNGSGFDQEVRQRMFDPFFSTKSSGRGLGLSSVLGIVRSHGGGLRVQSQPGKGTVIEVLLPLNGKAHAPDPTPAGGPHAGTGRVLVVDDEPAIRKLIARTLRRKGLVVDEAEHGEAALTVLAEGGLYTLVILDYTMPGMNGGETLQQIRTRHGPVPVLRISGFASDDQWGPDTEPSIFLPKPFTPSKLAAAVGDLLATTAASAP